MAAKTQAQWFSTLKSWVPEWFFTQDKINTAIMQAVAKVLSECQADVENQQMQTFILKAGMPWLDLHGNERSVERMTGELDPQYALRVRVKSLLSQLSRPAILKIVNDLLIQGYATMREDFEGSIFCDRSEFVNRGAIVIQPIENTYTILVDKQIRDPYSFVDREFFADREAFVSDSESSSYIFDLILSSVNENKAFGTLYRIIERI